MGLKNAKTEQANHQQIGEMRKGTLQDILSR
jgi:hypothetical protein